MPWVGLDYTGLGSCLHSTFRPFLFSIRSPLGHCLVYVRPTLPTVIGKALFYPFTANYWQRVLTNQASVSSRFFEYFPGGQAHVLNRVSFPRRLQRLACHSGMAQSSGVNTWPISRHAQGWDELPNDEELYIKSSWIPWGRVWRDAGYSNPKTAQLLYGV